MAHQWPEDIDHQNKDLQHERYAFWLNENEAQLIISFVNKA